MAARRPIRDALVKISDTMLGRARQRPAPAPGMTREARDVFQPYTPAPGVLPKDRDGKPAMIAMDEVAISSMSWAAAQIGGAFREGVTFLGYPYLAELAQRPEYRKIVERLAVEMTRKWIEIKTAGNEDKTDKIKELKEYMNALDVKGAFKMIVEQDGFFGRSHLYIDTGDTEEPDELKTPIGDGKNQVSKSKIGKGDLKALRPVEAVWTYPSNYNSNNPLKSDWYKPDQWFVMGTELHRSRLLTFVGRPVPDLLKPAYAFGGLALTQMCKPYIDSFIRNRESVGDLIHSFSTVGIKTNLGTTTSPDGDLMFKRAELFNITRDNRGLLLLQNGPEGTAEEFFNVSTPLGTLDQLLAQSLEFISVPSGLPMLIWLGIQPAGLNASSEGEIRAFYNWVHAFQEWLFRKHLDTVFGLCQLSLWGEVDEDLTCDFEKLWDLDEKAAADVEKTKSETDGINIDNGTVSPEEARKRIAGDPDSAYQGLDPDDLPEPPIEEGLTGKGRQNEEDPDNSGAETGNAA